MSPESKPIARKAHAKINLTLEVLGKRQDGYHEIISVMQAISLCDVLAFEPHDHLHLASDVAELVSPNNLVCKAAKLMQYPVKGSPGVAITLSKGIPLASGLGGGSSDAAVTLQVLNKMWDVNLPRKRLIEAAAQLGSDVAFFVRSNPTALATGRGEKVEALPSPPRTWVVLLRPPIELANKTREMYARLDTSCFTRGQHARRLARSIRAGERITSRQCFNVFDPLAVSLFPGLEHYRREFLAAGAGEVHLAGAGPMLFTLVDGRGDGEGILQRLRSQRVEAYLAQTV
ncbi:MAG: 4-(cytidine 5'-diphospho)-2-C-methyl-D-erythritol kinase [Dehalococcoidia bacterium]|nr:4-(cytidine 5'-diphospho)-2-C-methyl-D-erythritol kinase [Dehalococcoidia bacterium]